MVVNSCNNTGNYCLEISLVLPVPSSTHGVIKMARSIPVTQCPLCESTVSSSNLIHDCGYNFEQKEITDWERTRALLKRRDLRWNEEVKLKRRANEIQAKKHGIKIPRSKDAPGWTQKMTAKMIGESPANLSRDLMLAEALDKYPDLSNAKDKSDAREQLKLFRSGKAAIASDGFSSEDELQEYLVNNWDRTPLAREWDIHNKFRKGKAYAREAGEIDILAKHRKEPKWLVIELKKDQSSDSTVGQLLRYMGWVEFDHRANAKNDRVEGLIISKSTDRSILYAMYAIRCMSNISLNRYSLRNGNLQLEDIDIGHELLSV